MIGRYESLRWGNIGSRWLPVTVTVGIATVLLVWLLEALNDAQELAERTVVEVTARNMRNGLQLATAEARLHGREHEIPTWVGENPVRWLGGNPSGYMGDCAGSAVPSAGHWCFDRARGELVYLPINRERLRLRNADVTEGSKVLRWHVVATAPVGNAPVGLRVENVTPYTWVFD